MTARKLFLGLTVVALVLGAARRLLFGWDAPLWLDETYTGAIALQPTFRGLVEDCLHELGGPVYYSLIWAWEKIFGPSNLALRLPSLILALAVPLLVLWKGHPDRLTRQLWAVLIALWIPSFYYATEARSYSLLLALGCAQVILFERLLSAPSPGRAAAWCGLSAVFVLTHYHALLVTGFQGLAYLAIWRKQALRTWPATLLFAPVIAWMLAHFPIVLRFSNPQVAWQRVLKPADVAGLPGLLVSFPRFSSLAVVTVAATVAWDLYRQIRGKVRFSYGRIEALAFAASFASLLIVFGWGFVRPSFTSRYLIPFMPGVLLGVAVWGRAWGRRWRPVPWLVASVMMLATAVETGRTANEPDFRWSLSWETASKDLAAQGARRLIFLWDNPTAAITPPPLMARVAAFFFHREGVTIPTEAIVLAGAGDIDPNPVLTTAASRPGDAFIWVYDRNVPGTLATRHPPQLAAIEGQFRCRDYGRGVIGVVACLRG